MEVNSKPKDTIQVHFYVPLTYPKLKKRKTSKQVKASHGC